MKEIINKIYNRLQKEQAFEEKYPEVFADDGKKHILYLHCLLNSKGLYRMILPYLELNKTSTHSATIGTMHKWDFTKSFLQYDNLIEEELIDWADYIVLPDFKGDIEEIAKVFKVINPKVKICIDVTEFDLVKGSQEFIEPSEQVSSKLNSFKNADLISFPKGSIADVIEQLLNIHHPKHKISFAVIPDLISADSFLNLPSNDKADSSKTRIGIIGQPKIAAKVKEILPFILPTLQEQKDKIEIVLLGWKGKLDGQPLFEGLQVEYHKPVNIANYYAKIHSLNLDLTILTNPINPKEELERSAIKYIELAALAIPVAVSSKTKVSALIAHQETGIVIDSSDEWANTINRLVKDPTVFKQIGQFSQKVAWKQLSWNRFKANLLANTYM